jgi:hypothetical protein
MQSMQEILLQLKLAALLDRDRNHHDPAEQKRMKDETLDKVTGLLQRAPRIAQTKKNQQEFF